MGKLAKAVLTKEELDALPEAHRELFVERDGKFVLDVDVIDEMPQVSGLRSALQKERDARASAIKDQKALIDKYKDIDPERAREALKKVHELEDKALIDQGKLEEVVAARTERMQQDHQAQITKFQTTITEKETRYNETFKNLVDLKVESGITRAVTSKASEVLGIVPQALSDIVRRAREVFQYDEKTNTLIPRKYNGEIIYGKDPTQPMTMEEWLPTLKAECPHYFKQSGGAGGGNDGGAGFPKKRRSEMTAAEKAKFIGQFGNEVYLELPE